MGEPRGGSDLPAPNRRANRWWSVAAIVGIALIGIWALGGVRDRPPPDAAPLPSSTSKSVTITASTISPAPTPPPTAVSPDDLRGAVETGLPPFGGVALEGKAPGFALTRRDLPALFDAWTVVVRRDDGSLGHHGAVVTFPVKATPRENRNRVPVGPVDGVATPGAIVWPLGGQHARVRGDLAPSVLAQIAAATRVVDGRPQVAPPAGLRVIGRSPLRMPLLHELRYGGELGMTYTGLTRGGGFEDALYATTVTPAGEVHEVPAVASQVGGGNGTVAWEPSPGLVAYVGWSGASLDQSSIFTAAHLAEQSRILSPREWLALKPSLTDQQSDISPP